QPAQPPGFERGVEPDLADRVVNDVGLLSVGYLGDVRGKRFQIEDEHGIATKRLSQGDTLMLRHDADHECPEVFRPTGHDLADTAGDAVEDNDRAGTDR